MNIAPYSSKLLVNGQYGIYINDKLAVTTTNRDRFKSLIEGLHERAERKKSIKPNEVA